MRILLANEAKAGAGGVETYLAALSQALGSRGHAVALIVANPLAGPGSTHIDAPASWSVADLGLDTAVAHARAWQPDVVFSHNMGLLELDEALLPVAPVVKMMHGYFGTCVSGQKAFLFPTATTCARPCGPACLLLYGPRRCGELDPATAVRNYRWAARQRGLFNRYGSIIVASHHMQAEYVAHGAALSRVHVTPLFAAPHPAPSASGREPKIDVAFAGRLTPLKGAMTLLRATQATTRMLGRRVSLVIAGEGPERMKLVAAASEYPGVDLEVTGWLDPQARTDLFSRASLLAVPSLWPEPFGLVGLEAGSLGVPAVAFDVGGIGEWLSHGVNGVLVRPAGDAQGMAVAIANVLQHPDRRAQLSAGATEAAARFSLEAHLARLENILDTIRVAVPS